MEITPNPFPFRTFTLKFSTKIYRSEYKKIYNDFLGPEMTPFLFQTKKEHPYIYGMTVVPNFQSNMRNTKDRTHRKVNLYNK